MGGIEADLRPARSRGGHARGLEQFPFQPVHRQLQVQVQDPPRHRGPGAGRPDRPQGAGGDRRGRCRPCPPRPGLHRLRPPAARGVEQPHPADHRRDRLVGRAPGHRAQRCLPAACPRHDLPAGRHSRRLCPRVPSTSRATAGCTASARGTCRGTCTSPRPRPARRSAEAPRFQGQHLQHQPDHRPQVLRQQLSAARDRERAEQSDHRPHVGLHAARLAARLPAGHEHLRHLRHPRRRSAGLRAWGGRPRQALERAGHLGTAPWLYRRGRAGRDL